MTKKRTKQLIKTISANFGKPIYVELLKECNDEEWGLLITAVDEAYVYCDNYRGFRKARDLIALSLLYGELNSDTLDNK